MPHSFGAQVSRSDASGSMISTRSGPTPVSRRSAPSSRARAKGVLAVADADARERVGHLEVRVLTETDDEEQLVAARVHVEVVPVVEVAVGGVHPVEGLGRLVGEVVVHPRDGHRWIPSYAAADTPDRAG